VAHRQRVPLDLDGRPVVYELGAPTVFDKAEIRRRARKRGGRPVDSVELEVLLREGIAEVYKAVGVPDEADRLIGMLDELTAAEQELPSDDTAAVERLAEAGRTVRECEKVIEANYEAYRHAIADRAHYLELYQLEAVRLLLTEVDGLPGAGKMAGNPLTAAQLMRVPDRHLYELAAHALTMFSPSPDAAKN
jgi:hypothetical protein